MGCHLWHLSLNGKGKKFTAVELGVCSSRSCGLILLRGQEEHCNVVVHQQLHLGFCCISAPNTLPWKQLLNSLASQIRASTVAWGNGCGGHESYSWLAQKDKLPFLLVSRHQGGCSQCCPAQTDDVPASMEEGQEWQLLLAKAPQPFSSSCFFPPLAPLFWWHLGFVY